MGGALVTIADGYSFLEGPRWHDGRLWASDFYTRKVYAFAASGGSVEVMAEVPNQPSGLGWLPDGRMLVVSMKDHRVLRREADGRLVEHADLSAHAGGPCNDMVVDGQGRAYVGNFGFDLMGGGAPAATVLLQVGTDGTVTVAAEGMLFPNGAAITPDGGTLIVSETFGNRITAFDIGAAGSLSNRRAFATFGDVPTATDLGGLLEQARVAPDGLCLDADGCVWVADALGNRVLRVAPGTGIVDEISTGDLGVFACALGGDDGHTLFLCAAPTFHEAEASANHRACLLAAQVEVPGA